MNGTSSYFYRTPIDRSEEATVPQSSNDRSRAIAARAPLLLHSRRERADGRLGDVQERHGAVDVHLRLSQSNHEDVHAAEQVRRQQRRRRTLAANDGRRSGAELPERADD